MCYGWRNWGSRCLNDSSKDSQLQSLIQIHLTPKLGASEPSLTGSEQFFWNPDIYSAEMRMEFKCMSINTFKIFDSAYSLFSRIGSKLTESELMQRKPSSRESTKWRGHCRSPRLSDFHSHQLAGSTTLFRTINYDSQKKKKTQYVSSLSLLPLWWT